jgi:hypothetical protein
VLGEDWAELARRGRAGLAARIPFVASIIALVGGGLALTLMLTTRSAEDSYRLGNAREVNRTLAEARTALQRQVELGDSAPELAARARALGMIPAKDPARLVVAPDRSVVVVGKPMPAQGLPAPLLNGPASGMPGNPATPGTNNPQILAQSEHSVPVTIAGANGAAAAPAAGAQPGPVSPAAAPPAAQPGANAVPAALPAPPASPPAAAPAAPPAGPPVNMAQPQSGPTLPDLGGGAR